MSDLDALLSSVLLQIKLNNGLANTFSVLMDFGVLFSTSSLSKIYSGMYSSPLFLSLLRPFVWVSYRHRFTRCTKHMSLFLARRPRGRMNVHFDVWLVFILVPYSSPPKWWSWQTANIFRLNSVYNPFYSCQKIRSMSPFSFLAFFLPFCGTVHRSHMMPYQVLPFPFRAPWGDETNDHNLTCGIFTFVLHYSISMLLTAS